MICFEGRVEVVKVSYSSRMSRWITVLRCLEKDWRIIPTKIACGALVNSEQLPVRLSCSTFGTCVLEEDNTHQASLLKKYFHGPNSGTFAKGTCKQWIPSDPTMAKDAIRFIKSMRRPQ